MIDEGGREGNDVEWSRGYEPYGLPRGLRGPAIVACEYPPREATEGPRRSALGVDVLVLVLAGVLNGGRGWPRMSPAFVSWALMSALYCATLSLS